MIALKCLSFLSCLALIVQASHGSFWAMVDCAWGSHKRADTNSGNLTKSIQDKILDLSPKKDIKFFLYSKDHPNPYQIFVNDEISLTTGDFNVKRPTKIIIHGYKSTRESKSCVIPRDALLSRGDFNIIVVDWSKAQRVLFVPILYPFLIKRVKKVADYVGEMITFLKNYGMNLKNTTIIGHSLGAHVAGIAGLKLQNKVNRIIGLDPAAPYFTEAGPGERLSKGAATIVEVIHTDIEKCGLKEQLGHYDFYPNTGSKQPGCVKHKCSHSQSYKYYAESVTTKTGFYARRCSDWESMQSGACKGKEVTMGGLERESIPEGIYHLKTNEKSPYAMGPQ